MGGYWSTLTYDEDIYLTSIGNSRGAWTFYTEPADGINNGPKPYPPPVGVMFENYRITITNPLGLKEEYYYCAGMGTYPWHVAPVNYVEYVDLNHSNYTAIRTTYSFVWQDINVFGISLFPHYFEPSRVHLRPAGGSLKKKL
jgi:hypothetical protein